MLVNGLPVDSAFHRRGKLWTQQHELAAMVVEKVEARLATLISLGVDVKSRGKVPPPIVVTHPDRPEQAKQAPKRKTVSPGSIAGLFGGGGR